MQNSKLILKPLSFVNSTLQVCSYIEIIIIFVFFFQGKEASCTNNGSVTLLPSVEADMDCAIKYLPHPNTTFYREK